MILLASKKITAVERSRVYAFIPMFVASAAFWSLYQQQFTVVTIYSDSGWTANLFGWEMPVSWVQSINPVFIIVLSGVFAAMWTKLGDRQPSTPMKFALGTAIMGVAFLLFIPMAGGGAEQRAAARPGRRPAGLHDRRAAALAGRAVAVHQAGAGEVPHPDGGAVLPLRSRSARRCPACSAATTDAKHEVPYFLWLGVAAIASAAVLLAIAKPVKALMGGVR